MLKRYCRTVPARCLTEWKPRWSGARPGTTGNRHAQAGAAVQRRHPSASRKGRGRQPPPLRAWIKSGLCRQIVSQSLAVPPKPEQQPPASSLRSATQLRRGERDIQRVLRASPYVVDYIRQDYDDLASSVGEGRRSWRVLSTLVADKGLLDLRGGPPSTATLARAWDTVTAERAAAKAKAPQQSTRTWRDGLHWPSINAAGRTPPSMPAAPRAANPAQTATGPPSTDPPAVVAENDPFAAIERRRAARQPPF